MNKNKSKGSVFGSVTNNIGILGVLLILCVVI